jgi:IclR family pca regulon transcriptional regulator
MKKASESTSEILERGLRILDLFSGEGHGFTLGEISRRIGVNKTSVHRYVGTHCALGYLRRNERTGLYTLGARTMALAHSFLQRADLVQQVKPLVDEMHRKHDLHIDVGILEGDDIYVIYRRESRDTLDFRHFSTSSGLYYLATGKAAMAFMEEEHRQDLLRRLELRAKTDKTITDRAELLEDLKRAREVGYAVNREEYMPGLIAIGAPLISLRTRKVVGGVSFDASTARFSMEELEQKYGALLVELAKRISAAVSL